MLMMKRREGETVNGSNNNIARVSRVVLMYIKLTVLWFCLISQHEIWNVTSQHNTFCSCSGGSCEWEDEDEEDQEQDYSITFFTPLNFSSVASLHRASIPLSIIITLFSSGWRKKKMPSSYFGGLITAEQTACLSQGPAGIIFSHYFISARSLCSLQRLM